jgi:hypothetical protein
MPGFKNVKQVKAHVATLDPKVCRIEPHHSSSYIWKVWHPEVFGRMSYGFSSEEGLLRWANKFLRQ